MSQQEAIDSDLFIEFALDLFEELAIDNLDEPALRYYIEQCDKEGTVELVSAFNDWQDVIDVTQDELDKEYLEVRISLLEDEEFDEVYARILFKANQTTVEEFHHIKWKR
ncbi:MAG: DUF440 family protein [Psychrobium sp.]|nr:DUF440 family protein [Psychrobium sp.]